MDLNEMYKIKNKYYRLKMKNEEYIIELYYGHEDINNMYNTDEFYLFYDKYVNKYVNKKMYFNFNKEWRRLCIINII